MNRAALQPHELVELDRFQAAHDRHCLAHPDCVYAPCDACRIAESQQQQGRFRDAAATLSVAP